MSRTRQDSAQTDPLRRPRDRRQWFVVSYDIPDNKRRTKLMKLLEGYGHRAQFSVFECHLRPKDADRLRDRINALIVPEMDDVRIYFLCGSCSQKVRMLGKAERHTAASFVVI